MARFFITGDTHGELDRKKIGTRYFPEQKELTKNDYLLIAGDFGCVWSLDNTDKYLIKEYEQRRFTTLFIDGNHENHDALDAYPVEIWNGGKIHRISDTVIHLMRGQVYNVDGVKFFAMGGAESTDKQYRREGKTWWAREMPSPEEYEEAMANLAANDFDVDYVITHCAPEAVISMADNVFARRPNELTDFLTRLITIYGIRYKGWYHGHYHKDLDMGKIHCLYNRVIEL